jgi:tetratricopeptide (TPR) repeat protein
MALNLAFRSRDSRNVFWIDGSTTDNSISSIITIGKEVGVPTGKIKEQQEICQVVKRWLGSSKSGDWLIVVNNLSHDDDYLWEILSSERGRLVITTHQEDIPRMRKALQVDCTNMTAEEAKTTFCKLSGVDDESSDDNDILSLVSNLDRCPLAIALAASFIHQTKCPVTEYINNYQQILPEHLRASENQTLRFELKNLPTPPIMATWEITFRHIERTAPFAADLLQLMSMLDYHNIPVDLLYSKAITEIGLSKGDVFETAMGLLHSFALVSTYKDHRYQLHDLIGIWTRKKMGDNARSFARVSLSLLEEIFGRSSSNLSGYLSHAKAVLLHSANIPDVEQQRAAFQLKVGQVLYQEGGYSDAEVLVKECIGFYKSGNASAIEVADCAYQLALIEEAKKAYGEAVDWYGKARDGFVRTLGQGHVRTLGTLTRIAAVSELQGCYADAIQNYEQALAWSNVSSSASHPFTIQTSHSMGLAFDKQGRYRDAMDYYSRALEGSAQAIGEQQPYTLDIQNNMAITLRKQGRYEEAYRLYEKILNAYHQTLGHKPHPSTLNVYGNMALIDDIRGRHQNATQTYKRVLEQKEKIFGEDHLSTISTVNNMSLLLSKQGKHEEAVKLSLRALEAYERTLGEDDPLALDAVSNCGLIYEAEGNIPRAGGHYEHAIMRKAIVLGMDHPSTLATLANWAGLLVKLGNHEEALALQDEVLRGYQSALGPSHPDTLAAEYAMAKTLERMQRYAEAKPHLTRVLEAYQKLPGEGGVARETLANITEDLQAVDQKLASPAPLVYRKLA